MNDAKTNPGTNQAAANQAAKDAAWNLVKKAEIARIKALLAARHAA